MRSTFYDRQGGGQDPQTPKGLQYLDAGASHSNEPQPTDPIPGSGGASSVAESTGAANKQGGFGAGASSPKRELPPILKTPADRKSLMERCRQIMAASDAQKKPWDSKSKSSATASEQGGSKGGTKSKQDG